MPVDVNVDACCVEVSFVILILIFYNYTYLINSTYLL